MIDMWRARAPPVPLDFDAIIEGRFVLRGVLATGGVPVDERTKPDQSVDEPSNGGTRGRARGRRPARGRKGKAATRGKAKVKTGAEGVHANGQTEADAFVSAAESNGHHSAPVASGSGAGLTRAAAGAGLKDQRALTLSDNLHLFVARYLARFHLYFPLLTEWQHEPAGCTPTKRRANDYIRQGRR